MWKILLTVVFGCLISTARADRVQPLKFAVEPYCPYGCVDLVENRIDSDKPGFLVEIVREIYGNQDYPLEFVPMPFSRAVAMVRAGVVNGMIGMLKQDAPDLLFPTHEAGLARGCFVVRKGDSWRYQGTDSLRDKRFGGVAGYSYGILDDYLADYPKRGNVQLLSGEDALKRNLEMLERGRIDVTLDDQNRILHLFGQSRQTEIFQFAGCIDQPLWIFVPFSAVIPASAKLAEVFDEGIVRLRRSGELQTILDRYGLKDWR